MRRGAEIIRTWWTLRPAALGPLAQARRACTGGLDGTFHRDREMQGSEFGAAPGCVISFLSIKSTESPCSVPHLSDGLWDYFPNTKGLGRVVKAFETSAGLAKRCAVYFGIRRRNLRRPPDNVTILVVALATAI